MHRPTMVENMSILEWDLQSWALLWRPYRGCKTLSIFTSSGEKKVIYRILQDYQKHQKGVRHGKMPIPFLCCKLICAWGKQQDCPTPQLPRQTLLRWKSAVCTVLTLTKEVCWIERWKQTKSSLEMLCVTIACGGFIHPGLVAYVGRECWLTMPQLLSQPTHWSCVGPLQHNKEEGCSISCLSLHWEWLQSI